MTISYDPITLTLCFILCFGMDYLPICQIWLHLTFPPGVPERPFIYHQRLRNSNYTATGPVRLICLHGCLWMLVSDSAMLLLQIVVIFITSFLFLFFLQQSLQYVHTVFSFSIQQRHLLLNNYLEVGRIQIHVLPDECRDGTSVFRLISFFKCVSHFWGTLYIQFDKIKRKCQ